MDPLSPPLAFLVLLFSGWTNRRQQAVIDYLLEENRVLRTAYGRQRVRLTDDQRRRLAVKGKALGRRRLVARLANENPTWGYTRIRGALQHLGHDVARNTIKAILKNHGIEPAPERGRKTPWKTFLAAHWDGLAAADFFTVEVLTWRGLVRYVVFFVMTLKTRAVEVGGITSQPHEAWMTQMARNLTDPHDGFLRDAHYLILDRDPLYTAAFRNLLQDSGVNVVRLPSRSPNLNAFAERFVGSVQNECLSRIVPLGERHLRTAVREFVDHYHEERPHQGLGNALIAPTTTSIGRGPLQCRERLGGVLKFYYRAAA